MLRKSNYIPEMLTLVTFLSMSALANAQTPQATPKMIIVMPGDYPSGSRVTPSPKPTPQPQTLINTSKHKDYRAGSVTETGGAKGWDGKVQGRVLVTPVTVSFADLQDYDHIVSGEIRLNLILKNTLSGQTIRLDSRQLAEGLRSGTDKSRVTINVIVDNMSGALSEAACGMVTPSAENTGDDVNLTLSYSGCGTQPAQMRGGPIPGIIVHGGKHPHGDMSIVLGGSETAESSEAYLKLKINPSSNGPKKLVIITSSSKGAGSSKAQNF